MARAAKRVGRLSAGAYVAVVQTAAADGRYELKWPAGLFATPPVVVATGVSDDGRDIAVSLIGAPTTTSVIIQARKSRPLPLTALLSALLGFDTLAPVAASVHVAAFQKP